jgi:hypothetical protein
VTMTLNGTLTSSGVIDVDCADDYSSEFRSSLQTVVSEANTAINHGQLCVSNSQLDVIAGPVQFTAYGTTVSTATGLN